MGKRANQLNVINNVAVVITIAVVIIIGLSSGGIY